MANLIGQTLLNQYRVEKFIAAGGMGSVYRVWDLKRNVPLAMKVLHDDLAEDPTVFKRFRREANALKKLAHPHIVPFYGLHQTNGYAFLLEGFIDGPSLKDILREKRKVGLAIPDALICLKALSAALGYAHAHGVVHCDVKPGNVLIDWGGNIFLTDFGVARHAESTATNIGVAGTPAYMPPEQILGKPLAPASDVYALGAMFFEMVTGQRLFHGDGGTDKSGSTLNEKIRHAQLHTAPPDPRIINRSIPKALAKVILKSLEKESSMRYPTVQDFYMAACEAVEVPPASVIDRVEVSKLSSTSPPITSNFTKSKTANIRTRKLTQIFRTLPAWQAVGSLVIVASLCTLIGLGALNLSPQLFPEPTSTITPSPTKTATQTATLTPTVTSTPPPTQVQFFTEGFSSQLRNWRNFTITNNDKELKFEVSGGFLNLELTDEYLWTYFLYEPVSYKNVRITVRVDNRGKNFGTLVVCNFTGQDWYEFRIHSSGLYSIYYREFHRDGKHASETFITNGGSVKIKSGQAENEYTAVCIGNELTLYINGTMTETVIPRNQILQEGRIGIGVYTDIAFPVSVGVDQIQVSQP